MKKYNIENHIGIFDGFYDKSFCDRVISLFKLRNDYSKYRNDERYSDQSLVLNSEAEMNNNRPPQQFSIDSLEAPELFNEFQKIFWEECYPNYLEAHPYSRQIKRLVINTIKIQKTIPGGGYHVFHFEHADALTSRRVMFLIMYLNDVVDGGETEFLYQKTRVIPQTGRLVLSPAAYTHVHRGNPPLSGDKYIITTWIDFADG